MEYQEQVAALQAAAAQDAAANAASDESALREALGQPAGNEAAPAQAPESVQPGTTPPEGDSDFDHGVDINSLPEEAREYALRAERMMKAAMTRRTQEAAPWRKLGEEYGVSKDEAAQALSMWQALGSDPTYARQLHSTLEESLRQQGLLPQERPQQQEQYGVDPSYGQGEWADDPYASQIDDLKRRLDQYELTDRERQQAQYEMDAALRFQQQEFALRQSHPDLTNDDFSAIYDFAHATNGDLEAAHERWQFERDRAVQAFVARSRQAAQSNPVPVPPGAHGEVPPAPPTDMKSGSQLAREMWTQHLNR